MKNEKLELLLNKMVEYNQPNIVNFKGYLYKDNQHYYIKVVEVISGTVSDMLYLKDGEEQYITHADKPKLMRVSLKSWHYRLIKFVLRDNTPTPKTMQNGCPYWWLLVFSVLVVSFVLIWKVFKFLFLLIPRILAWYLEKLTENWVGDVDDETAYEIYYGYDDHYAKMPVTIKMYFDRFYNKDNFFSYYISKKYNINQLINRDAYNSKYDEISDKWNVWRKKKNENRKLHEKEISEKHRAQAIKRSISEAKWNARIEVIENAFNKIFTSIREAFTFKNQKNIIRRTKQIVGAIITILLLTFSFVFINAFAGLFMVFIDLCIENWRILALTGIVILGLSILFIIWFFVSGWVQSIVNKYNNGRKIWYVEPLIYLIYYPIKYIFLVISFLILNIIWIPIKYIFYKFLWKIIFVGLGKIIWNGFRSLGRNIASSTGVFGEYFGASYSDYCPGIEWVDVEDEK